MGLVAGLAMVNVLIGSLKDGFASSRFRFGAFAALVVGLGNLTILKIGAPFWALIIGVAVSLIMEADHFKTENK